MKRSAKWLKFDPCFIVYYCTECISLLVWRQVLKPVRCTDGHYVCFLKASALTSITLYWTLVYECNCFCGMFYDANGKIKTSFFTIKKKKEKKNATKDLVCLTDSRNLGFLTLDLWRSNQTTLKMLLWLISLQMITTEKRLRCRSFFKPRFSSQTFLLQHFSLNGWISTWNVLKIKNKKNGWKY